MSRFWTNVNWIFKHRKAGIPFSYKDNTDYIDWFYNYRPRLAQFNNIHSGEDCFIIGNGPSLNKTNLSLLKNYYTFGLNKIYLIFEKHDLNIDYHVAMNSLVIEQIKDLLEKDIYNCPSFISYSASKNHRFKNPKINKLFTNNTWSFYETITSPINEGYTVTFVAMQIAFFMGFKNVFLIGVDHNFIQSGKSNDEQKLLGDDENHFHPDYFKGQQWHLADLEGSEASYSMAKHQFHQAEREIYDATIGGKLEVFKKITYEEAVAMAKRKN